MPASSVCAALRAALRTAAPLTALVLVPRLAAAAGPAAPAAPADTTGAPPELVTDRPDYTESPLAVPFRSVQVEAGTTIDRTGGTVSGTAGELLLRVGVMRRAELRVGLNSYTATLRARPGEASPRGREDASLGAKVALLAPRDYPSLVPATAFIVGTSLPTGSAAVRQSAIVPEAKLLLGWTLPAGWELASNLNVSSARAEAPAGSRRITELAGSLSAGHALTDRLAAYAELFGGRPEGGAGWQYANGGITFGLTPLLQLDVRAGTGVGGSRGDYFLGAGVSRRF